MIRLIHTRAHLNGKRTAMQRNNDRNASKRCDNKLPSIGGRKRSRWRIVCIEYDDHQLKNRPTTIRFISQFLVLLIKSVSRSIRAHSGRHCDGELCMLVASIWTQCILKWKEREIMVWRPWNTGNVWRKIYVAHKSHEDQKLMRVCQNRNEPECSCSTNQLKCNGDACHSPHHFSLSTKVFILRPIFVDPADKRRRSGQLVSRLMICYVMWSCMYHRPRLHLEPHPKTIIPSDFAPIPCLSVACASSRQSFLRRNQAACISRYHCAVYHHTTISECRNFKPLVISTVARWSQFVNYTYCNLGLSNWFTRIDFIERKQKCRKHIYWWRVWWTWIPIQLYYVHVPSPPPRFHCVCVRVSANLGRMIFPSNYKCRDLEALTECHCLCCYTLFE